MNSTFKIIKTSLKDAVLIVPFCVEDGRGNFVKDFLESFYSNEGLDCSINETFFAKNTRAGVLRGMHFATKNPQSKIVRSITGEIMDVIVDLRKNSPTYMKWEGFILSEDNNLSLYVPKGFAHRYITIKPGIVSYKCCGKYDQKYDSGVVYNDPTFGIKWPDYLLEHLIISEKDRNLKTYKDLEPEIDY